MRKVVAALFGLAVLAVIIGIGGISVSKGSSGAGETSTITDYLADFTVNANGDLDVETFKHGVQVMITAQEIIVDNASYPTPAISRNSVLFRPLGLGYANLGALLMSLGMPYDSEGGRAYSAAITALMCGEAYHTSALVAGDLGPFAEFQLNREPMLRVIRKHPRTQATPFIMATGRSDKEQVKEAINSGANNYIIKPFDASTMKKRIEAVIGTLS